MTNQCASCCTTLKPDAKFCTGCGTAIIGGASYEVCKEANGNIQVWDHEIQAAPWYRQRKYQVIALIVFCAASSAGIYMMMNKGMPLNCKYIAADIASGGRSGPIPPDCGGSEPLIGQSMNMYVTISAASVDPEAFTTGDRPLRSEARGTKLEGTYQTGTVDKNQIWLKLNDGSGFVNVIDLSPNPRPKIVKEIYSDWTSPTDIQLLSDLSSGAESRELIKAGSQLFIIGIVEGDYAEVEMRNGGVRYFEAKHYGSHNANVSQPGSTNTTSWVPKGWRAIQCNVESASINYSGTCIFKSLPGGSFSVVLRDETTPEGIDGLVGLDVMITGKGTAQISEPYDVTSSDDRNANWGNARRSELDRACWASDYPKFKVCAY